MWAVVGLLFVAVLASGFTAYACDFVLRSFQDTNAMVMLITDSGTKSDDKNLEKNLSTATMALVYLRDIGSAVVIGSIGVAFSVAWKMFKGQKG